MSLDERKIIENKAIHSHTNTNTPIPNNNQHPHANMNSPLPVPFRTRTSSTPTQLSTQSTSPTAQDVHMLTPNSEAERDTPNTADPTQTFYNRILTTYHITKQSPINDRAPIRKYNGSATELDAANCAVSKIIADFQITSFDDINALQYATGTVLAGTQPRPPPSQHTHKKNNT